VLLKPSLGGEGWVRGIVLFQIKNNKRLEWESGFADPPLPKGEGAKNKELGSKKVLLIPCSA